MLRWLCGLRDSRAKSLFRTINVQWIRQWAFLVVVAVHGINNLRAVNDQDPCNGFGKGADSMLSVYSRHYPPCPSDDINYKRCRCPKWINGILGSDGPFIRRSAKTRSWERAEDFKRKLEEEYEGSSKAWKRPPGRSLLS